MSFFNPYAVQSVSADELEKPRLTEHLTAITKQQIPKDEAARYCRAVLLVICNTVTDADVKYLALRSLQPWTRYYLLAERQTAYRLVYNWLINMANPLLNSEKLEEQRLYVRQANQLTSLTYYGTELDVARELVTFYCQQLLSLRVRFHISFFLLLCYTFFEHLFNYNYLLACILSFAFLKICGSKKL